MTDLKDSKILILSTNGFQQEELFEPKAYFEEKMQRCYWPRRKLKKFKQVRAMIEKSSQT